jgi:hypothetical protein
VTPSVVDAPVLALKQRGDDVDGFGEHLVAHPHSRPALTDDVLIEILPRAEPEPETVAGQDPDGGRLLGHDRWVVTQGRTGHVGHETDPLGGLRGGTEDRPRVARVSLLVEPGWKWSLVTETSKPASSAMTRSRMSWSGGDCSVIMV